MFRSKDRRGVELEDNLATLAQQDDNVSDDDNAAPEMQSEVEEEREDPLLMAIDDLEGRVVAALDDMKVHPGVRSSPAQSLPEELATMLRPVMEVAAHTAPSVARTYYQGVGAEGVEQSCEDVYERVVSDLILPVLLETAQSDTIPAKRGASLEFFRLLWKEWHKPGSWLDPQVGPNAGPYGNGQIGRHQQQQQQPRAQRMRRQTKRLAREAEILRYWVQASIACMLPGVFTNETADAAIASRGVIAASASIRPSLKHIAQRIGDTDDRGANRVFAPVMKMVEGVLKKLFLTTAENQSDSLRSACLKFLEIVCFCCSAKPKDPSQRRTAHTPDDFSLEDLPAGHPVITREALESIGEYAFSALRGLTLLGGQVKIDGNLLSDMMMGGDSNTPSAQVVSILKPAALAYLEMETNFPKAEDDKGDSLETNLDRSSIEFDFVLSPKSYALTINAVAALATNRPVFFHDGAVCLARRAADPPVLNPEGGGALQTKSQVLAIQSHLKASCLTLLRNVLSVQTQSWQILQKVLAEKCDMEIQAEKALNTARQAHSLKTAGRAARNYAKMFYAWETSQDSRTSKRQRETDDALAKMRAAKAARGLGHGIQLPTSMVDSIELVFANLQNLPTKRPAAASSKRKTPISLDFVVDAVMTNGASLTQEEGRWYTRDGGSAWSMQSDGRYELSSKLLAAATEPKKEDEHAKLYRNQCNSAASDAVERIVLNGLGSRNGQLSEFANNIAARLAWTLKGVAPSTQLKPAQDMALDTIESCKKRLADKSKHESLDKLASSFPLVTSCLALEATSSVNYDVEGKEAGASLSNSVLNEAYSQACNPSSTSGEEIDDATWKYESCLDVLAGSILHSSERANEKATDNDRKRVATKLSSTMQAEFGILPSLTPASLDLVSAMCDVDDISKKAAEAARKQSQQTIAASAALHAARQAAEKRATTALLALRDAAFQRSDPESRKSAVRTAVALAAGRLEASSSCEDKALKLVMNVLYARSEALANFVVEAAIAELTLASEYAIENYSKIQDANAEAAAKALAGEHPKKSAFAPESEEEKLALEKVRKPAVLFMALCIRRPDIIKTLFELSSVSKADVLSKSVRQHMPKLARAAGTKHGTTAIALKIAEVSTHTEAPLLLAFLDNLAPVGDKNVPPQEFIEVCYKIQESKMEDGKKDARYIIPVVSAMTRIDLVEKLPEFVEADDKIFMAALVKMGERLGRQALLYRDEPEPETPSLKGMTLCEQLVFLHNLDFAAVKIPQKRYLGAIRLCLDNDEIFNDRVVMSALDHMSGTFLTGSEKLPLAYMRTIILVVSKHESLHNWICHTLLPRLVEGKIYNDKRQWEGWMRCAKMLENNADTGVSSAEAINKLPPEQLANYRSRYGNS